MLNLNGVHIYIFKTTYFWNPSKNTILQELEKDELQLKQAPDLNIYLVFIQLCFHNFWRVF